MAVAPPGCPSGRSPCWSAADVGASGRDAPHRPWRAPTLQWPAGTGGFSRRSLVATRDIKRSARSWSNGWCHPYLSSGSQASSGNPRELWTRLAFQRVTTATFAPPYLALIKLPHRPLTCPACPSCTGGRLILTGRYHPRLVTELDGCRRAQVPRGLYPPPERHRRLLAGRRQPESRAHAIASHSARATCVCTRALPTHSQLRCSAWAARVARRAA